MVTLQTLKTSKDFQAAKNGRFFRSNSFLLQALKASNENTSEIETIEARKKVTWLPPQPFLDLGVKARLMFERLRARSEI